MRLFSATASLFFASSTTLFLPPPIPIRGSTLLGFGTTSNKSPSPPIRSPSHARGKFRRPKTKKKLNFSMKLLTLNPRNFSFDIYRKKSFFRLSNGLARGDFQFPTQSLKKPSSGSMTPPGASSSSSSSSSNFPLF